MSWVQCWVTEAASGAWESEPKWAVVLGGMSLKKNDMYLWPKTWRYRFITILAPNTFFFKVNFGAESTVYYQFWWRRLFLLSKALCKDALYCTVGCVCIMYVLVLVNWFWVDRKDRYIFGTWTVFIFSEQRIPNTHKPRTGLLFTDVYFRSYMN